MPENTLVVSQPMFLPWLGLFEQISLCNDFVHYDDVQLPQGRSFISRVQIKLPQGPTWLTAPIDRSRSGHLIHETFLRPATEWRQKHLDSLHRALAKAPHADVAMALAHRIYDLQTDNLAEFNIASTELISSHLGLKTRFHRSSSLGIGGSSSRRLLDLCQRFQARCYITGHGAFNYLDHGLFDAHDVIVRYMRYARLHYPQPHGSFTPFVSILDAIANCGPATIGLMTSDTVRWQDFSPMPSA